VVLEVDDGTTAVCFNAPVVELRRDAATPRPSRARRSLEQLGPDLCGPEADVDRVLQRLHDVPADRPLGDVLLDQRVAAGIGNVFKSEICWARRVHPSTPVGALSDNERRAIYETAHAQLYANLGGGRRVTYRGGLAVYGKLRRPCPRCRTPIRRAWDGDDARVTYWCPACQPIAVRDTPEAGTAFTG
jgi:endonuclease-8